MYPELKNLYKGFDREPVVEDLNLSLEKRPVSTVFQSYGLFPHMTVLQNVICGLEFKGVKTAGGCGNPATGGFSYAASAHTGTFYPETKQCRQSAIGKPIVSR